MRLLIAIPGNPWQGRINARDRATVSARGRLYNRKLPGFAAYQASVAAAARAARQRAGVAFGEQRVEVWITLYVADRRRRDLDGPIKALLDGLTDGGVWSDDSQVWSLHVRKAPGEPRAVVLVELLDRC